MLSKICKKRAICRTPLDNYDRFRQSQGGRNRGLALLLVLLFVVLLSAIIVEFAYEMRIEAAISRNHIDHMLAQIAAKSAVATGMSLLRQDLDNLDGASGGTFDALTDVWATGVPYEEINGAVMRCTVSDEYGKLNVNALFRDGRGEPNPAVEAALRKLFELRGCAFDPVDAIMDWIDSDDEPRQNGGESEYYSSLGVPYSCKNAPLDSIEELLLIRGITPEVFFGDPLADPPQLPLTELLTVFGPADGTLNANTASEELLNIVGEASGRTGLAQLIVQARQETPFQTEDDLVARGIVERRQGGRAAQGAPPEISFGVAGRVYRIHGDGYSHNASVRIEAYVSRNPRGGGNALRILDWRIVE